MGTVWSATHRRSGTPVAVKVMHQKAEPWFLSQFREEVRSVASLDHPNVVRVFDYGQLDRPLPGIPTGAPYLVMELATEGTLTRRRGRLEWPVLRPVLQQVLLALGHAHARGIIHRDLKAGNVLVSADGRPILTDFGLALLHHRERAPHSSVAGSGTPRYMAPEQFRARWRDLGPWTDLYAFGVLAWALVSGRPPFMQKAYDVLAAAHLGGSMPQLQPRMALPEGVEGWLGRLLAKDPALRFCRAAEALAALDELGDPVGDAPRPVPLTGGRFSLPLPMAEVAARGSAPATKALHRPRPRAGRWLLDAGVGLFGLRRLPLVGRSVQQDDLEQALRRTVEERRPQAVVLRGPSGCGKSALASWLADAAHEAGLASKLFAEHGEKPGLGHGVAPMLARWLHAEGLAGPELAEHLVGIGERLGADDIEIDAWLALLDPLDERRVVLSAGERLVALRDLLARGCGDRALVLHLDDVQWGPEALGLASLLLDSELPVLLLLTAREEALAEQEGCRTLLDALQGADNVATLHLGPLDGAHRTELVAQVFGLAPSLAHRVAERTAGNPLFAVQLVGDWVQRGLLASSPEGYHLRGDHDAALPDGLVDVWTGPLERALEGRRHHYLPLLAAASLGPRVDRREWPAVCRVLGAEGEEELVEVLTRRRLATPDGDGWRFAHGMLRETVIARALPADVRQVHDACTLALGALRADPERVGHHALQAGRWATAGVLLLQAAERAMQEADLGRGLSLLQSCEQALVEIPDAQQELLAVEALRARLLTSQGRGDDVAEVAQRIAEKGQGTRWAHVAALARGRAWVVARRHEEAESVLRTVLECDPDEQELLARAHLALAMVTMNTGRFDEAEAHAAEGLEHYRACEFDEGVATVSNVLGHLAEERGDWVRAEAHYMEAHDLCQRSGSRFGRAIALDGIAAALMFQGQSELALDVIHRSLDLVRRIGSRAEASVRQDLGVILLSLGRAEDARDTLLTAKQQLEEGGMAVRAVEVLLPLCWAWAQLGDAERFAAAWEVLVPHLDQHAVTASRRWVLQRTAKDVGAQGWTKAHQALLERLD